MAQTKMAQTKMAPSKRILVIKHGALGDIVQALDGFACLRAGHGDDHLAVLTSPAFAGFLGHMPFFDAVHVDHRKGPLALGELLRMRQFFRQGWDRIYDFQSSGRTIRYFKHLIPREVEFVGVPSRASHPLPDMTGMNNRDRMVLTAKLGGCPEVTASLEWLKGHGDNANPDIAVLIPGCSPAKPAKRWPAERFAALARKLLDEGYAPVIVGTELDREVGNAIKAKASGVKDLIGKTDLFGLASLLSTAGLVVGNDTGPVFMAARLGAPTVMVMSRHTDPDMSAPVGSRAGWVKKDDIAAVLPEEVLEAVRALPEPDNASI